MMTPRSRATHLCVSASIAALLAAAPALAQKDGGGAESGSQILPPAYGVVTLETGYVDDPFGVALQAGGQADASTFDSNCWGNVAEAPDVTLDYTAGNTFPLNIYVGSNADTTLMVLDPSGAFTCNDDTNGLQPAVFFDSPQSGEYDIWVGTYSSGSFPEATLFISEVFSAPSDAPPIFGPLAQANGDAGGGSTTDSGTGSDSGSATDSGAGSDSDMASQDTEAPAGMPETALGMFEMASQMSGGMLSYASAQAMGDNGFEAVGLSIQPPNGSDPITVERLVVSEIDWQSAMAGGQPAFLDVQVEGLHVPDVAGLPDVPPEALALLGEEMTANMAIDFESGDGGSFVLNQFMLDVVDLMVLDIAVDLSNFDVASMAMAGPMAAMGATINSATISFTDMGMLERALTVAQEDTGMAPDQAIQMGLMQMQGMGGMVTSEAGQAALNALVSFMSDYPNIDQTLTISANPATPVNAMALMSVAGPDQAIETLGLTVTYE